MSSLARWAGVLAGALSVACGDASTTVHVRIDAEPGVRGQTATLAIEVVSDDGSGERYARELAIGAGREAGWPAGPVVVRRGTARGLVVTAIARRADRTLVAEVAGRTSFVPGEARELRLVLEDVCVDHACVLPEETCRAGACASSCVASSTPGGETPSDPAPCADDGGAPDAGPEDAATDADTSLVDGGCPVCQRLGAGSCVPADDGAGCPSGACHAGACCTGCWDDASDACRDGAELALCGVEGGTCVSCTCSGDACVSGACVPTVAFDHVSAYYRHACASSEADTWCWGNDDCGQLGIGGPTPAAACEPTVGGVRETRPAYVGAFGETSIRRTRTCAVSDGHLYCWGRAPFIPSGSSTPEEVPVPAGATGAGWDQVVVSQFATCARTTSDETYCWGKPDHIGRDTTTTPADEPGFTGAGWTRLTGGHFFVLALTSTGGMWGWGTTSTASSRSARWGRP